MPQTPNPNLPSTRQFRQPFQIAQADPTAHTDSVGTGETHAAAGTEEKHQAGEIPDAKLLFWNSLVVVAIMVLFGLAVRKKMQAVPKGIGNFAETIAELLNDFVVGIVGHGGEKYTPLVGTIFVYIVLMNLIGLIPGFHSPTGNLSITLALGIVVFIYVQAEGIRANGLLGWLKHFAGPMPAMAILMFPVELISELVKPFTLAIRLFGNIFGEDVILAVLAGLGLTVLGSAGGWIPFHFPVMLLSLLTAMVQALVFSMLTCIYLSLMTHHDHEAGHDAHGHDTDDPVAGNEQAHMVAP